MAAHPSPKQATPKRFTIGQVLERLNTDFTDLTLSKLRFLEEQGLIVPERKASGYRQFTQAHIERLRLILTLQRDHYLPLKKISEILEDADAGKDPVIPGASRRSFSSILSPHRVLSRDELLRASGVPATLLAEAISCGLIPSAEVFAAETVMQLQAISRLSEHGITPRHMRPLRVSAEKDADLLTQAAAVRTGNSNKYENQENALQLAELLETVRSAVVRNALQRR